MTELLLVKLAHRVLSVGLGRKIVYVDCVPVDNGAAGDGAAVDRPSYLALQRNRPVMGHWPDRVSIHSLDDYVVRVAETGDAFGDGVKHRLEISGGSADDPEDLAGGGLLLEGLGEVDVQAGVFQGDRGLIGEGLEEGDLLGGEGADLRAADDDRADRHALSEHRHH